MTEESSQDVELEVEGEITEESAIAEPTEEVLEETNEEHEEKKPQSRNQNSKQRQRRLLREQAAEIERLKAVTDEIPALKAQLDSVINPPPLRPNRVDFDTEEEYEDELYNYRNSTGSRPAPVTPSPAPQQPVPQVDYELEESWEEKMEVAEEKYPDFQAVIASSTSISVPMADAIKRSDDGGEVAYFLGKNPTEAAKICSMHPVDQIRAIDKLGSKFKSTTTKAPEPIEVSRGKETPAKDIGSLPPNEYLAARRKQMAGK